ncbi:MAG: hypothetical protein J4473_03145 [Candidatus Aenigmarchaeota archaeon]|nr:hypothetical protein [Candidatus Aenigmarchaeota archaeon]
MEAEKSCINQKKSIKVAKLSIIVGSHNVGLRLTYQALPDTWKSFAFPMKCSKIN